MSTDGETSNRLSDALDQIFSRPTAGHGSEDRPEEAATSDVADDGSAADEPFELPEIVPATEEPDPVVAPTLPARSIRPESEPSARDDGPAPGPAATAPVTPETAPSETAPSAPARSPSARAPAAGAPVRSSSPTAWGDHVSAIPSNVPGAGLRAPGRRPRVRRVTRVLRHVDPWSTFKVAVLFSFVTYLVALTAGVLLWRVADSTGTLDNVERWFTQFGWETFELEGGEIFHNAWIIGLFGVVAMTGALVLLATVFNLVSDIIGGIRLTVLEEEVVERTITSTRRYVIRQGPAAAGAPASAVQDWDVDDTDGPPPGQRRRQAEVDAPTETAPTADWSVD